jgi:NhaD family Na+/H+ antiporter
MAFKLIFVIACWFIPAVFVSASGLTTEPADLTDSRIGYLAVGIFIAAYLLVMAEEYLHLRKSKPVLVAAGIIWALIGWHYVYLGMPELAETAFRHNLLEYAELLLFLLVAMTYINAMEERLLFDALRSWMLSKGLNLRTLFWLTGSLAFFISPIADNLTTALLMCAVVLKVAGDNKRFINLACINIVVAANAGGAFSPFGDITTLMVWQKGMVEFNQFAVLFLPSLVNFVLPAAIMTFFIPQAFPLSGIQEKVRTKRGAKRIVLLFLLTVASAVAAHSVLHMPPVLGMMTGLGYLQFFGYFLRKTLPSSLERKRAKAELENDQETLQHLGGIVPFDVFNRVAKAEWDTLLFFYGVIMCVGGLGFMGYLSLASAAMYGSWDTTTANIVVGLLSAVVDNIPVMFAVLSMQPDMALGQWLLVTLTAGVGGSLLSVGSAAGVALMGQARGLYTFVGHLRWAPVIAVGYISAIYCHLLLNKALF